MTNHPTTPRPTYAEEMDRLSPDTRTISAELGVLRRLNRMTASARALLTAVEERLAPQAGEELRLLDIGCGDGSVAREARAHARNHGWRLDLTGIDHLAPCLAECARADSAEGSRYLRGDIRESSRLLGGATCDIVHASLVLHHLRDDEVVAVLREMGRVGTRLVVWNDLIREQVGVVGALLFTLGAPRAVRRDAIASVRKGFTLNEAEAFAEAAGLREIQIRRWRGGRFLLSALPPAPTPPPAARPMLRATRVGLSIRGRTVLQETSLVVAAGTVALIEGPNGCGKSSLLRVLSGAQAPSSGRVWCDRTRGVPVYLPQQGGLISALDTMANIEFFQRVAGIPRGQREARARDALMRFCAGVVDPRGVVERSLGQTRRAALASVFASASGVVLLDEPDAAIDASGRAALTNAVVDHCRAGGCCVIATHHAAALQDACRDHGVSATRMTPR